MPRPLRVFLCHASQDKPAVRELYNALKSEGWIDPWLDKAKILPGQDWEFVIEKAVDDSDVVIACLSGQSVTKEGFVQREIRYAYDIALEKPEETIFLIPLRLDDCIVPRKLRTLHWVDYFGEDKEDSYSDLLEALKLRYEQKMRLEAEELERQRKEEIARQEAEEIIRKFEAERMETKKRNQTPPLPRSRKLGKQIASASLKEDPNEVKPLPKKPFTKLLEPSSLSLKETTPPRDGALSGEAVSKPEGKPRETPKPEKPKAGRVANLNYKHLFSIVGPSLISLVLVLFGVNYFINIWPVVQSGFIKSNMVSDKDGMTLIYVPAGNFVMGSDVDNQSNEKPEYTMSLDAFWIDQTEVTNKQYMACVDVNVCEPPSSTESYIRSSGYYGVTEFDNYPVIYVDWNNAKAYCEWVDRRLPTEAEWEKAASWDMRKKEKYVYPWGSHYNSFDGTFVNLCDENCPFDSVREYINDGYADTSPVGNYPSGASPYGVLDMAGNVWEWVNSLYQPYPYNVNDGRENLSASGSRVLRGGSWNNNVDYLRTTIRIGYSPVSTANYLGFRCARSP